MSPLADSAAGFLLPYSRFNPLLLDRRTFSRNDVRIHSFLREALMTKIVSNFSGPFSR